MEDLKVENNLKKNRKADIPTKSGGQYSYQYIDIAQIHEYLQSVNAKYIQKIQRIEGDDYIFTKRCFDDKWEDEWLQGCKVVDATLYGVDNPAQKQGSALTYARRYSLLMAFGLATEDDDAQSLSKPKEEIKTKEQAEAFVITFGKHAGEKLGDIIADDSDYANWLYKNGDETIKNCLNIILQSNKEAKNE